MMSDTKKVTDADIINAMNLIKMHCDKRFCLTCACWNNENGGCIVMDKVEPLNWRTEAAKDMSIKDNENHLICNDSMQINIKTELNDYVKMLKNEIRNILNEDKKSMTGEDVLVSQIRLATLVKMKNDLVGRMIKINEDIIDKENS